MHISPSLHGFVSARLWFFLYATTHNAASFQHGWGMRKSYQSSRPTKVALLQSLESEPLLRGSSVNRKRRRAKSRIASSAARILNERNAPSEMKNQDAPEEFKRRGFLQDITKHNLLTRDQEFELGIAIQKSKTLQQNIESLLEDRRLAAMRQAEEQKEIEHEWFSLMGEGKSTPFGKFDSALFGDDLSSLSLHDRDAFHLNGGDLVDSELRLSRLSKGSGVFYDDELDRLTDEELYQHVRLSRTQIESILLEGSVARNKLICSNIRLVVNVAKDFAMMYSSHQGHLSRTFSGSWCRPSLDDAIQEGIDGLVTAADRFDPGRKLRFATYATWWITNSVRRCFQEASVHLSIPRYFHLTRANFSKLIKKYIQSNKQIPPVEELAAELGISANHLETVLRSTQKIVSLDATRGYFQSMSGIVKESGAIGEELVDHESRPDEAVEWSFLRQTLEQAMATELDSFERDIVRLRLGLDDGVTRSARQVSETCGGLLSISQILAAEKRAYRKLRSAVSISRNYQLLAYMDLAGIDASTVSGLYEV